MPKGFKKDGYDCIEDCGNKVSEPNNKCQSCAQKHRLKDPTKHANYKDGRSYKPHYCKCGTKIKWTSQRCKKCAGIQRVREGKWYINNSGENNPRWIDGRSELHYSIVRCKNYCVWRLAVIRKDDYKCIKCGEYQDVEAHHKIPFAKILDDFLKLFNMFSPVEDIKMLTKLAKEYLPFWNVDNGETLCEECHQLEHKKVEV